MEALINYYTLSTFFLAVVWLVLFVARDDLRREMLILGIFSVFLMPLIFTLNQLNAPEAVNGFAAVSITDLVFAFSLSGIAGTLYHGVFGKHYHKLPRAERVKPSNYSHLWVMRFFITFLVFIWTVVLLNYFFSIAAPQAFLIASAILAIYIVSHRNDLLADSLWSSFLTAFVVFLATTLASFFTDTAFNFSPILSEHLFLGVPTDLLIWSAAAGLALGPLYEFIRTLELK